MHLSKSWFSYYILIYAQTAFNFHISFFRNFALSVKFNMWIVPSVKIYYVYISYLKKIGSIVTEILDFKVFAKSEPQFFINQ